MMKTAIALAVSLALAGCGTMGNNFREMIDAGPQDPSVVQTELKTRIDLPPPAGGAVVVAVYNFRDMTGQRKSQANVASLSSAVTQGADAYLIRSLQTVGGGQWFKVVERGGLDNIVKERQLIRQMRELYEGKDARPLPPMVFAGMIFEGGIIGYDSNVMSGGAGARILGIGAQTEYRQDEVVISLRAVSVATGEVLASVTMSKTVISFQDKAGVLRFNELGTRAVEAEIGSATNESMNKAVQLAIHGAVIEMIKEGERKGHWQFKKDVSPAPKVETAPAVVPQPEAPKVEAPKEENKNVVVPNNSAPKAEATPPASTPPQLDDTKVSGGSSQATTTAVAPAKRTAKVIADGVNVRETKVSGSPVLITVKKGTIATIIGTEGRVMNIEVPGPNGPIKGWILAELVEEVKN